MFSMICMADTFNIDRISLQNLCQIIYLQAIIDYKPVIPLRARVDATTTVQNKCILIIDKMIDKGGQK
jgi:hypothetical protein